MRRLSDRQILSLAIDQWGAGSAPSEQLQHTGLFLWLLVCILALALAANDWLLSHRLEEHCNDLANPAAHIECTHGAKGKAGREAQDVRHDAHSATTPGPRA